MFKKFKKFFLLFVTFFGTFSSFAKFQYFNQDLNENLEFKGKIATGTNFDIFSSLLNNSVSADKGFANRISFDAFFNINNPVVEAVLDLRMKAVWGNNKTSKTSFVQLKDDGGYLQPLDEAHQHTVNLPLTWLREAWFQVDLREALGLNAPFHSLTIGSFPFQLGRGIALGDAYAVNPGTLGFYTDGTVDQYAYGVKFTGGFFKDFDFSYDIYTAILQNNSTGISDNLMKTQAQFFDRPPDSSRGFGKVNWIGAVRLNITPVSTHTSKLKFEPYVVHNSAPEQTIEVYADAKSKLTSVGMAMDAVYNDWEGGFDGAMNFGAQDVRGLDRNVIQRLNVNGVTTYTFSDVYTVNPAVYPVGPAEQLVYNALDTATRKAVNSVPRSIDFNGAQIPGTTYYNSPIRFRAPYTNIYKGYMFVSDIGYWAYKRDLKLAFTAGIASGDMNPNTNLLDPLASKVDGDYKGFVSLQELYAGKLVKSVFVMGGSKKLVRPLSTPPTGNLFSTIVDTFSNLVFTGVSLSYLNKESHFKTALNPNLLVYWEQAPGNKFDLLTKLTTDQKASKFLGTEFNLISRANLSDNVVVDFMMAVFQPGSHYVDVHGQPFTLAQRKQLDSVDPTDLPDYFPLLWSDVAYSFATGLTYTF